MLGKERFTGKAEIYDKYRPTYKAETLTKILDICGIEVTDKVLVADIGSGTGKFTKLLLDKGFTVYSVDPNDDMRKVAELKFKDYSNFYSINATAENTSLQENKFSLITAAQSFHYFELEKTRREFERILKHKGKVALLWNFRLRDSEFISEYENIIYNLHSKKIEPTHAQDKATDEMFEKFFNTYQTIELPNEQEFDFDGLWGRTLSNNHVPDPKESQYEELKEQITELFKKYQKNGKVIFQYKTKIVIGELKNR